jgi:outer membrane protein OmpA-like peptidoglycan-associated protein
MQIGQGLISRFSFAVIIAAFMAPAIMQAQATEDEEGCKDSSLLTRMPKSFILECSAKEFDSAEVVIGPEKEGESPRKTLEGKTEILNYECPETVSLLQIARNMETAMRQAGYQIVFSGKTDEADQPAITARKGATWIQIQTWSNGGTPNYRQTAVTVKEMTQEVKADASAWAAEIEKSGRVSVYGINFDTGKSAIRADSEPVLQEIATLLREHPEWKLRIVGHTDSTGSKAANRTLSEQRAAAVAAWIAGKGIEKARLASEGVGDTSPVADNGTDEGRAKNRRVELVKM